MCQASLSFFSMTYVFSGFTGGNTAYSAADAGLGLLVLMLFAACSKWPVYAFSGQLEP
jgi:hypothetical protein